MMIGALIISYKPTINVLRNNVIVLKKGVDKVIIVDNGSDNRNIIHNEIELKEKVQVVYNDQNEGIAAALNRGMTIFEHDGYEWVLTMDQDSVLDNDSINFLKSHISNDVGIICPRVNYLGWPERVIPNAPVEEIESCMTSASLTSIKAWKECGKFREDFFIDYVDDDFCKKLRLGNYKIVRDNRCTFEHRLGEAKVKRILGKTICYSLHSPIRCYYMARNILAFNRIYRESIDTWLETKRAIYIIGKNILVCKPKMDVLKYTFQGIVDALRNHLGEYKRYS